MAGGFSVTISAVDGVTKTIDAINKKMAGLSAPYVKLGKSLDKFADVSGLSKVAEGFGGIARKAGDAFQRVGQILPVLGGITSAASIAGMYRLVTAWADWGAKLGFAAQRIGISASSLSSLQGAARLAGASAGAMTSGLQTLGQTMYDAIGGRAPEAVAMFNTLGVAFSDGAGHARSVTAVLPELADKIAGIRDPYTQARVATAAFGGAAEELLPFLRKGSAGIAEYTQLAQRYGVTNDDAAAAANRMREAQARLTMSVEGLGNSIALQLAPVIEPLLIQMADWIAKNREWIASGIGDAVRDLATWLKGIDFAALRDQAVAVWHTVDSVAGAFGGWKTVAEGLIALKLGGWALGLLAPFGAVAASAVRIAMALGAARTAAGAAGGSGLLGLGARAALIPGLELAAIKGADMAVGDVGTQQDVRSGHGAVGRWIYDQSSSLRYLDNAMRGTAPARQGAPSSQSMSAFRPVLDMLGRSEGTDRGRGYDETLGYGAYTGGAVNLTGMSLAEVGDLQKRMLANPANKLNSSAVGRYQFVSGTLSSLAKQLNLDPSTKFTPEIQDKLAVQDLINHGGQGFLDGKVSAADFQRSLSKEWASVPDPETGRSAYGQGTGVASGTVQSLLSQLRTGSAAPMQVASAGSGMTADDLKGALSGSMQVELTAPPGYGARVRSSSDNLNVSGPRVARSAIASDP